MIIVVDPGIREESLGRDEFVNPVARIVERCGHTWKYQHYASMQDHEWTHASGIIICGTALKDNGFWNIWNIFLAPGLRNTCPGNLCRDAGSLHDIRRVNKTGDARLE